MGDHTLIGTGRPEPVLIADAVKAVLAALVTVGWVTVDNAAILAIGTAVALVVTVVITLRTRANVTPLSDPVTATGDRLVPVADLLRRPGPEPHRELP